jgi:hypothetical protein
MAAIQELTFFLVGSYSEEDVREMEKAIVDLAK